jgi:hypothetical protein
LDSRSQYLDILAQIKIRGKKRAFQDVKQQAISSHLKNISFNESDKSLVLLPKKKQGL